METRHYISFGLAIIALQLFIFIFNRSLAWLFNLNKTGRKWLNISNYLLLNGLVLSAPLQLFKDSFRLSALVLALLLFSAFASLLTGLLYKIFAKRSFAPKLKWLYPLSFIALLITAIYNAYTPVVRHYQIQLDKPMQPLRIGLASDLHLGKLFGGKQLDQLAQIMQQQKVDVILLAGDIMDDNVNAYLTEKMQPHLAKLQAPLGVFATMGNHDFFGDQARIEKEIRKAGIHLLMDQSQQVAGRFMLIGRNDDLVRNRPSLAQLMAHISEQERQLPIIVMDHRPSEITENAQQPIDIQVSGHAHNGQVFPANLITKLVYRLSYGYEQIQQSHFFVTSGYGFWGVPFRLGSQSEVMIIGVKGNN